MSLRKSQDMIEPAPTSVSCPTLSVVVPVYNGKPYIHQTLESIAAIDGLLDCEVIFQDALSTDGTSGIIDRFCEGHPRRHHFREKDGGQSDAINRGVSRANGRWVTWLCADDILLPDLGRAIEEGERAGADVVYGDVVFSQENGVTPAIGTETCENGVLSRQRLIIQQPGTCILRKAWQDVDGVETDLNWSMDYDLFMRLETGNFRFYRSRRFVAIARIHRAAKTSSGSIKRLLEIWSIVLKSHLRRPEFFRSKPYLVYGLEYIIKYLESKHGNPRIRSKILGRLHRVFWVLVRPKEAEEIQNRFREHYAELLPYLKRMET